MRAIDVPTYTSVYLQRWNSSTPGVCNGIAASVDDSDHYNQYVAGVVAGGVHCG
ncbi:hypothetical protein ACFCZV_31945 [Streptomyces hydrogenans]|uniref:hypothetical protein n=1 Tax=Streptomyces hydrogenans TaxID=1873719 RepID=UPI0035DE5CF2